MAILDTIRENLGTAGQITADLAKRTAETLRLRDQIRRDRKDIRLLTYKIGETYLRLHEEDYEEEYAEFFEGIAAAKADIDEKMDQLAQLKEKQEPSEDFEEEGEWDDLFDDSEEIAKKAAEAAELAEEAETPEFAEEAEAPELAEVAEAAEAAEEAEIAETVEE